MFPVRNREWPAYRPKPIANSATGAMFRVPDDILCVVPVDEEFIDRQAFHSLIRQSLDNLIGMPVWGRSHVVGMLVVGFGELMNSEGELGWRKGFLESRPQYELHVQSD